MIEKNKTVSLTLQNFAISMLLERFVKSNSDHTTTAKIDLVETFSSSIPAVIPSVNGLYDGKTVLERTIEHQLEQLVDM